MPAPAFTHTRALAALLPVMLTHCSTSNVVQERPGEGATDPEGCRSFASAASVRQGEAPGDLACSFDPASRRHTCVIATGDATLAATEEYASLADFIEAGRYIGKRTSLRETRSENGAARVTTFHYDELGRLTRSQEEAAGTAVTYQYRDYDDAGRPRRAVSRPEWASEGSCGAELVRIEYSDVEGTVSREFQPADSARCGFARRRLVEHYDERGNRVSVDEADGSGVATLFEARPGTKLEQVCL